MVMVVVGSVVTSLLALLTLGDSEVLRVSQIGQCVSRAAAV